MPTKLSGRELIKQYIKENDITLQSLGAMYGISKAYVSDILSGKRTGKKPNELVLKIIDDFKLEIKN